MESAPVQPEHFEPVRFEGVHCSFTIDRPARGVVLLRISGNDVGEFGSAPREALKKVLESFTSADLFADLFIDAREAQVASIDVSGEWAQWLAGQRGHLRSVTMLTGSRFIQVTAEFVRRFAALQDIMTLTTNHHEFNAALLRSGISAN